MSSLVLITDLIPDAELDIRYASERNFTGHKLYAEPFAMLSPAASRALAQAADLLRNAGYKIVIWDSYRPETVQKQLLANLKDERYVSSHSNHCNGTAVDMTICSLNNQYLDMGTDHDDFTRKAHVDYPGLTVNQALNRKILSSAMQAHGFKQWPYEWWHFDYIGLNEVG